MSLEDIEKLYLGSCLNDNYFTIPITKDVTVSIGAEEADVVTWDTKGNDYEEDLKKFAQN